MQWCNASLNTFTFKPHCWASTWVTTHYFLLLRVQQVLRVLLGILVLVVSRLVFSSCTHLIQQAYLVLTSSNNPPFYSVVHNCIILYSLPVCLWCLMISFLSAGCRWCSWSQGVKRRKGMNNINSQWMTEVVAAEIRLHTKTKSSAFWSAKIIISKQSDSLKMFWF